MNNNNIVPVVTYTNLSVNKFLILSENKKKSGIYRWNNLINGKFYIGSSINLSERLRIYYSKKAMLSKLSTRTSIIYSAILKHGYTNFSLDILEYCDMNILIQREQHYLDILKPEYNILKIANSRLGSKQSEATKIKISISNKGKHLHFLGKRHSYETRKKISFILKSIKRINKPKIVTIDTRLKLSSRSQGVTVKIFDKSNNFVKEFSTITSTAEYFGLSNKTVSGYLNNNKPYNGYTFISNLNIEPKYFRVWVYDCNKILVKIFNNNKETSKWCNIPSTTLYRYIKSGKLYNNKFYFYNELNLVDLHLNKESTKIKIPFTEQTLLKLSLRTVGVKVKIFNILGNLEQTFPSITSAAKYFGVSNSRISCIPNNGLFKGYKLRFEEEDTRVWVYDCDKKLVNILNTTKETSLCYNINRNTLNTCIRSGKEYKKDKLYFYKLNSKSKPQYNKDEN